MIYKNIILFLVSSLLFSQTYPEIGSDDKLDIITWNIENFPKHNNTINYVTDIIDDAKDTWDADNVDGESSAEKIARLGNKPTDITLP